MHFEPGRLCWTITFYNDYCGIPSDLTRKHFLICWIKVSTSQQHSCMLSNLFMYNINKSLSEKGKEKKCWFRHYKAVQPVCQDVDLHTSVYPVHTDRSLHQRTPTIQTGRAHVHQSSWNCLCSSRNAFA